MPLPLLSEATGVGFAARSTIKRAALVYIHRHARGGVNMTAEGVDRKNACIKKYTNTVNSELCLGRTVGSVAREKQRELLESVFVKPTCIYC